MSPLLMCVHRQKNSTLHGNNAYFPYTTSNSLFNQKFWSDLDKKLSSQLKMSNLLQVLTDIEIKIDMYKFQ